MTPSRFRRIDRRRLVASSAIGGAAILTAGSLVRGGTRTSQPAALAMQDDSSDVPMFRGDAARTGVMPGPGPDDSNGVEAIWTFATGDGIYSSPAVVDGVVYAGSATDPGGGSGMLYAVDAASGSERWRFAPTDSGDSPTVVDGVVFAGTYQSLYAIDATNGAERWRFATDISIAFPAVVDGVVFAGSSSSSGPVYLFALNADDGTERWRFEKSETEGWMDAPAVVDGVVYAGSDDGVLYAVHAEDGTERWRFAAGDSVRSPAVADGVVFAGAYSEGGGMLFALNAEDGTERWRFATDGDSVSSPAVVDGVVYARNDNGTLYAVNSEDGTELWELAIDGFVGSPVVVDGVVYAGTGGGMLYAVNAVDGSKRWQFKPGGGFYSSPVVVNSVIYIGDVDGTLYAIGARVPRLGVGATARVTETTSLRGGPAATAVERAELEPGTMVTITGEAVTTGDVTWWPVVVDEPGAEGWVEASALEPLTSGPPSPPATEEP